MTGSKHTPNTVQVPIVFCYVHGGFEAEAESPKSPPEDTGLLYYGGVIRHELKDADIDEMPEILDRLMKEELLTVINGELSRDGATYSGGHVEVYCTFDLDSDDAIIHYRVPFKETDIKGPPTPPLGEDDAREPQ